MTQTVKGGIRAIGTVCTGDTLVYTGPCIVYGARVNVVIGASAIDLRDALSAGAGTVMLTIPALLAIGSGTDFGGVGCRFNTGLFVDFASTGTVTVLWEPVTPGD